MAKIVKLENIQPRVKGQAEELTEEYVCGNCRHLIEPINAFCWLCGEKLEQSKLVEHYYMGQRLSNEGFDAIRGNFLKPN